MLVGLVVGAAVTVLGYLLVRVPLTQALIQLSRTRLRPLLTTHITNADPAETGPDASAEELHGPDPARIDGHAQRPCGDPRRSEPAPSAAQTWAAGPRDTMW